MTLAGPPPPVSAGRSVTSLSPFSSSSNAASHSASVSASHWLVLMPSDCRSWLTVVRCCRVATIWATAIRSRTDSEPMTTSPASGAASWPVQTAASRCARSTCSGRPAASVYAASRSCSPSRHIRPKPSISVGLLKITRANSATPSWKPVHSARRSSSART